MTFQSHEENMEYVERILREIVIPDLDPDLMWNTTTHSGSSGYIYAYVLCNDTFWWATADCERILPHEIDDLKECCSEVDDGIHLGSTYWVARKRNLRPMYQILDQMSPERRAIYLPFEDPSPKLHPKTRKPVERYPEEIPQ